AATTLVRTAGAPLLPVLVLLLLIRRRARDAAIALAAGALTVLPWQLWLSAHSPEVSGPLRGSYGPYLPWVVELYERRGLAFAWRVAGANLASLWRSIGVVLYPGVLRDLRTPLLAGLLAALLLLIWRARDRAPYLLAFLGAYLVMVACWPFTPDRFLWAVWPLWILLITWLAVEGWREASEHRRSLWKPLLASIPLLGHVAYGVRGATNGWHASAQHAATAQLLPVARWVATHTAPRDTVAASGHAMVALYTGRVVVPVNTLTPDEHLEAKSATQRAAELEALLLSVRARTLVLSADAPEFGAIAQLDGRDGRLRVVPIDRLEGGGAAFRVEYQR
ncbi:MAG: hypothetical protein K2X99_03090, partial [Gemmatimonadaceae bacterium]|nr:hypothetical protein [Gemmatimonadaceae bacterium]